MYHFVGIKGTGMSSLAQIMNELGYEVNGSDIEKHFFTEVGRSSSTSPLLSTFVLIFQPVDELESCSSVNTFETIIIPPFKK